MIASPILNLVKRGRKTSQRSDIFQPPWSITNQNSKPQPHRKRERESYKKKEPRSCHKLPETEKNICSHVYDVHTGPGHANGKYRWATTDQPTDRPGSNGFDPALVVVQVESIFLRTYIIRTLIFPCLAGSWGMGNWEACLPGIKVRQQSM